MKRKSKTKFIYKSLIILAVFALVLAVLNVHVTTRQGIDFQVQIIKVPLYLKIISFMDRHYNYKQLVKRIIKKENDQQKKVLQIFIWTYHNIKKQPKNLPIIDDHAWHIIVRGYGVSDQSCDVFSTLCNYAGLDAFFTNLSSEDNQEKIRLSFVKLDAHWFAFDPYNGVYFTNKNKLADIADIKEAQYQLERLGKPKIGILDYKKFIDRMPDIKDVGLRREKIQSPFKRILFEIKKWFG